MFLLFKIARRLVAAVVLLAVLGTLWVGGRIWWVGRHDDRRASDVLIVLGASQFDGRPSPVLKARLDHAKALYDAKVAPVVITVGGKQAGDRFTEGAAGRRYLADAGVPARRLVAVESGSDTVNSLKAVDAVMTRHKWRTAVIVTDRWHSLRSRTIARHLGIDAVTSPAPTGAPQGGMGAARYIGRESAAYVYYELFHRGSGEGPDAT